eukprot:s2423_g5.t1
MTSWGWQQQDVCITGLVRVDLDMVSDLLRASGRKYQHNRWFFEPLRYDKKLPEPFKDLPEVSWTSGSGLNLEQCAALAEEKAVQAGMGLKLGSRQVGVRMKRTAESNTVPRMQTWRAVAVPRGIDVGTFEDIVTSAGFEDFQALEKFRWRNESGFVFRARRDDAKDLMEIEYGSAVIQVGLQGKRPPKFAAKAKVQLPGERRVKFSQSRSPTIDLTSQTINEPSADMEVEPGDESNETPEEKEKKRKEKAKENRPPKKAKVDSVPTGFTEVCNPGDGDCLFWSLSQALAKVGSNKSALQCRAMAVSHLRRYSDTYQRQWDGCYPKQCDVPIEDKSFNRYLDELAQPKA